VTPNPHIKNTHADSPGGTDQIPTYKNSADQRFLVEFDFLYTAAGAAILVLVGIGAIFVAIFSFSVLALAVVLVCLPVGLITWLYAKALRDVQRDE
jgi:hypothetical protein